MTIREPTRIERALNEAGAEGAPPLWRNLSTAALYEQALQRHEGRLSHLGPLVVSTGQYTGRSPRDKFLVREPSSEQKIWWGEVNQPFDSEGYEQLRARMMAYLQSKDLFVQDCYLGAAPSYRLPIRVVTELAWHSLFARNMFIRELDPTQIAQHQAEFTLYDAPGFRADPEQDGTNSEAFVLLNFGRREILIGGTEYAGEIKKAMFTVMNYLLPPQGVLTLHCSASYGNDADDVALFFGLSGTGKTTLSADPSRTLIGDDEHGWGDDGVFNLEGGCYAKVIRLSQEGEPEIYETTRRFGTLLENVVMDPQTRRLDLDSDALTENTRASYPISHIVNATRIGTGGHPKNVLMLTADAFGVLPPIAKLSTEQAVYHFLSGYTAKVAGTERGVKEPKATFSPCFGAPFMALDPMVYADLLGKKLRQHGVQVWLVNTGWSGGAYGTGHRIKLAYTRAMVTAALNGHLTQVSFRVDPNFRLQVPESCPGVPADVLDPRRTWSDGDAYDQQARRLARMFDDTYRKLVGGAPEEASAAAAHVH